MNNKTDIIDIYSFGIFLNTHLFTYKYILSNNNIFSSIFYFFAFNLLCKYGFQYSILNVMSSKFWIKNFDSIAMPLLLNSVGNIVTLNIYMPQLFINRSIIELVILLMYNNFLKNNYPNEKDASKMFRFNSTIFYFLVYNLM
jgi:hypothetical protein